MSTRVAVIGGGIAGITCACELAGAGIDVVLFEAKKNLGGRAFSFLDKRTGVLIDNCQHVLLGCCGNAIDFLSKIGSLGHVEFSDAINIVGAEGETLSIKSSLLPAPFHLFPSIMRTGYLSAQEKRKLSSVMLRMLIYPPVRHASAGEYFISLGCSNELANRVLNPIIVSALNEDIYSASAKYARMVLIKALIENRFGYRIGVPNISLSELIEIPAIKYLSQAGCEIRTSAKIEKLHIHGGRIDSITVGNGEKLDFNHYVCALPPIQLNEIGYYTPAAEKLNWRSIVSAHIFYGKLGICIRHACLANETFQWVFNKSGVCSGYIQAVASAADGLAGMARDDIAAVALRAISKAIPELENISPEYSIIVQEKRATFSTGSGGDEYRVSSQTAIKNLFLAGDWTDTHWPATIESAVRSGYAAARAVINAL